MRVVTQSHLGVVDDSKEKPGLSCFMKEKSHHSVSSDKDLNREKLSPFGG